MKPAALYVNGSALAGDLRIVESPLSLSYRAALRFAPPAVPLIVTHSMELPRGAADDLFRAFDIPRREPARVDVKIRGSFPPKLRITLRRRGRRVRSRLHVEPMIMRLVGAEARFVSPMVLELRAGR